MTDSAADRTTFRASRASHSPQAQTGICADCRSARLTAPSSVRGHDQDRQQHRDITVERLPSYVRPGQLLLDGRRLECARPHTASPRAAPGSLCGATRTQERQHGIIHGGSHSLVENNLLRTSRATACAGWRPHDLPVEHGEELLQGERQSRRRLSVLVASAPTASPAPGSVGVVLSGNRIINYEDPDQPLRCTLQGIGCSAARMLIGSSRTMS